jgi:hypothetical protein
LKGAKLEKESPKSSRSPKRKIRERTPGLPKANSEEDVYSDS